MITLIIFKFIFNSTHTQLIFYFDFSALNYYIFIFILFCQKIMFFSNSWWMTYASLSMCNFHLKMLTIWKISNSYRIYPSITASLLLLLFLINPVFCRDWYSLNQTDLCQYPESCIYCLTPHASYLVLIHKVACILPCQKDYMIHCI